MLFRVKPGNIELPTGETIAILYEDRSVLAIDKPAGWMLVPFSWQNTGWNLQAALASSIANRDFWARSRNLRFLRYVHRLDAETSGILLLAKSPGAVEAYGELFESRQMEKIYLAIVEGAPKQPEWDCRLKLAPDPRHRGRMRVDPRHGKTAETHFKLLETRGKTSLIEARPLTGRTHQIRVHLAETGVPIVGDEHYGRRTTQETEMGLRAVELNFADPFTRRPVRIKAASEAFCRRYGYDATGKPAGPAQSPRPAGAVQLKPRVDTDKHG
jgi:23S rRNA pseudouridine1911/1915/1917 synthase